MTKSASSGETKVDLQVVREMLAGGARLAEVGRRLGVSRQRVHRVASDAGLDTALGEAVRRRQRGFDVLTPRTKQVVAALRARGVEPELIPRDVTEKHKFRKTQVRIGNAILCIHSAPSNPHRGQQWYRIRPCRHDTATHEVHIVSDGRIFVARRGRIRSTWVPAGTDGALTRYREAWPLKE